MAKVVAKFQKVSYEEFKKSWIATHILDHQEERIKEIYNNIKLPERITKRSSGYNFFYPGIIPFHISLGKSVWIPTGIRCVFLEDGYDLSIYPTDTMKIDNRIYLHDTVNTVYNDYFEYANEGHIVLKLSCDGNRSSIIRPEEPFAYGVIREFFLAQEDE